MAQLISVGEALVEIMRPVADQPLDQAGLFHGPFASGAPAIFAVAAARLGARVSFIGGIGADAFGRLLRARLDEEGVDTSAMQTHRGYTTGIAFVAYAADGRREFVFHLRQSAASVADADRLEPADFAGVSWLHLSGSALVLSENSRATCQRAWQLTQAAGGRLSFDPNLRPELLPLEAAREIFQPYLEAAELLLPTAEEARALAASSDDDRAADWLRAGSARIVVLKRGASGCTFFSDEGRMDVPGFAVEEVDPTGAGDCFNAACVVGLEAGWSLAQVARYANAAGALAVSRRGPMEGAPTLSQIKRLIATA